MFKSGALTKMVYVDRRGLFMNGKAEAASGAPTCEKRVNTFSFCGTGGSLEKNAANSVCGDLYL